MRPPSGSATTGIPPSLRLALVTGFLPSLLVPGAEPATAASRPPPPHPSLVNAWMRAQTEEAQHWDLGGQFRVRYDAKENAGSFPNRDFLGGFDNSNDYLQFRSKVHLGYQPTPWLAAYVEGRDSHVIGDRRATPETDTFDLHQAYLRLGDPKQFPLSLKLGRQELSYGDERFLGVSDWSNFGRSFDAAKVRWEHPSFWVDAFTGRQVIALDDTFNHANDYDWLSGVYLGTRELAPFQDTEVFVLTRDVAAGSPTAITPTLGGPGPRDVLTAGTRWKSVPGRLGPWDYLFEFAGQTGSLNLGGRRQTQDSFSANFTLGYSWKETWGAPRLAAGYDFASGDENPADGANGTFEPLFGTNHKLYGVMDLFGPRNTHIPRAGFSLKPAKGLTVAVDWLGFWLVETADYLYPETGGARTQNGYGRHLDFSPQIGNEIDVLAAWQPLAWGQVQAGYGHFFPGTYLRQTAALGRHPVEEADWFYVSATFGF